MDAGEQSTDNEVAANGAQVDESVRPLDITVDPAILADLSARLRNTRWPNQIDGAGWTYGTELGYLKDLCAYWADGFDWAAQEQKLLAAEHVVTTIDGQQIHAMVARSPEPDATPLLMTHGWPGSVAEFLDVIGPLSDPRAHGGDPADAFHVVCPSLPGFGWSGPTTQPGWDVKRIAEAWPVLMSRLGFDRFIAQGGDWGSMVSTWLGIVAPEHLIGIHLNMPIGIPAGGDLSEAELADLADATAFLQTGCAYQEIQGKNPQTLGYGLDDSPAGMAGWIIEKFWAWTDNNGSPEDAVSRDALLTNLTIYWATQTAASSARIYFETMKTGRFGTQDTRVEVPTAATVFPKEIIKAPKAWLEAGFNLVRHTRYEAGGHFAAMEQPTVLVDDIVQFARSLR